MFPQPGSGGERHEDLLLASTRGRGPLVVSTARTRYVPFNCWPSRSFSDMSAVNIADSPGPSGKEVSD